MPTLPIGFSPLIQEVLDMGGQGMYVTLSLEELYSQKY